MLESPKAYQESADELYGRAVAIVLLYRKCYASLLQRLLQLRYDSALALIARMEKERLVGPANSAGKREILIEGRVAEALS